MSILFLAMPANVADLAPSASKQLWMNDIYGFMVSGFLVTMATSGDRIGRRRVIGAVAFAAASALAAFSSTAQHLIFARAVLGMPVRRSLTGSNVSFVAVIAFNFFDKGTASAKSSRP